MLAWRDVSGMLVRTRRGAAHVGWILAGFVVLLVGVTGRSLDSKWGLSEGRCDCRDRPTFFVLFGVVMVTGAWPCRAAALEVRSRARRSR